MDTVLMVIGILGFGAVVIATYVFTVAARDYVSENTTHKDNFQATRYIARSPHQRRTVEQVEFPVTINGILVPADRRFVMDRRLVSS